VKFQNTGTKPEHSVWFASPLIFSVNQREFVYALRNLLLKKTENVYHVTIQTFGITIRKNVNPVLPHMFMTRIEESVFVLAVNLLIQEVNVSNVWNQVTGSLINEDVSNVQTNKSTIESEVFAFHVLKMPLFLKIMNATLALTIVIMTRPEWCVLYVHKDKTTTIKLDIVNVPLLNLTDKMKYVWLVTLLTSGTISV
jgi:hypothetical protein